VCDDPRVALLAGLFAAWWPMHARQAAVVNNDVLAKALSAWTLVLALDVARHGFGRARVALALSCALAGLAAKTTAVGVLAPLVLACAYRGLRGGALSSARARLAAGAVVLVLVAAIPLAYALSQNPAIPRTLENFSGRVDAALDPAYLREFLRTSIGAFNWYSRDLPAWLHGAVLGGLGLGVVGLGLALLRRRADLDRGLLALCLAAAGAQLLLVFLRGAPAGRYALPALPAFALLVAVGVSTLVPDRWRPGAVAAAALALLAFDSYFTWTGLLWNQYGVWGS